VKWLLAVLAAKPLAASAEEMVGQLGSRTALVALHAFEQPDGSARVTGEYIVLPTLQRRFLEGERSPQLGLTALKEGTTPILFGHHPTGELRGAWRGAAFKGMRYGPGGQERERFEFTAEFPPMEGYSATVRCQAAADPRYASSLGYAVENGSIKAFEWRSSVQPGGHSCELANLQQQPFKGGLRLVSGDCQVTLRDLGDAVKVAAEGCRGQCGSEAYLEPVLVERRGTCRLLRPEVR
jgi:hypothetical protein